MDTIRIDSISFSYTLTPVLVDLSLSIQQGQFWTVVGPNGSGKSTLVRILSGLIKPHKGTCSIQNKAVVAYSPKELAQHIAVVRQEYIPAFGFTVRDTVAMARLSREDFVLFENDDDRRIIAEALDKMELNHLASRKLNELSGGERQRVFIARALAQNTPIILLDEPTTHLDLKHQVRIFELLKALQKEQQKTIFAVTHDINLAARYCDLVLMLSKPGRQIIGTPAEVFTQSRLRDAFEVNGHQGMADGHPFFIPTGQ